MRTTGGAAPRSAWPARRDGDTLDDAMAARGSILLGVAAAIALAGPARARPHDWTGSAACGVCHPAALAAWQATAHARAGERWPAGRAERADGRCQACHTTGEAPAGVVIERAVGCEACHGAGAAYAEADVMRDRPVALALGLVDVSTPQARAAVCQACHRRPTRGTPLPVSAPAHPPLPGSP